MCISAGKAWFFLDGATLVMGAGVTVGPGCRDFPATTSLQQSNLLGGVVVGGGTAGAAATPLPNGSSAVYPLASRSWVWHDGVVMAALASGPRGPMALQVATDTRVGSEVNITQGDNTTIRRPVFAAQLNHGPGVANGTYAYVIAPAPTPGDVTALLQAVLANATIIGNTRSLQAVCERGRVLQAVLWPNATGVVSGAQAGCWDVHLQPGRAAKMGLLLQVKRGPTAVTLTVAAPAQPSGEALHVVLNVGGLQARGPCCAAAGVGAGGASGPSTVVTMSIPAALSGGASVSCSCNLIAAE